MEVNVGVAAAVTVGASRAVRSNEGEAKLLLLRGALLKGGHFEALTRSAAIVDLGENGGKRAELSWRLTNQETNTGNGLT
jgi:hypothetical protein